MRKVSSFVFAALLCGSLSSSLLAQEVVIPSAPTAQEIRPTTENVPQLKLPKSSGFTSEFLQDEKALWTAPFRIKRGDVKWLAPIGLGAAALMARGDSSISNAARNAEGMRPASKSLSRLGSTEAMAGASVSLWALGKVTHNDRLGQTGKMATDAVLHTQLIVQGLKMITQRQRPNGSDARSFPSGHAATSFAFASVLAHEYRDKPLVAVGAYGLATAISLSRVGGLNHFPSDVLIGATIGELIGRYIVHRHHAND